MQLWLPILLLYLTTHIVGCHHIRKNRFIRQVKLPRYSYSGGDPSCTTPLGQVGRCVPLQDCYPMKQSSKDVLKKSICGFEATEPRVCCPYMENDEPGLSSSESTLGLAQQKRSNNTSYGRRNFYPFPADCGKSLFSYSRIVGGQEAALGAWPWMAVIYYVRRRGKTAECGGALISSRHVLTAAHCIVTSRRGRTMSPRQLVVRLGEHDIESPDDGAPAIDLAVHSVIKYSDFDHRTFQNDIAILMLNASVSFTHHIAPICIPFHVFSSDLTNRNAFAAGWGTLSYGGLSSSKLQEVQLRIWENSECHEVFKKEVPITDANLCAGDGDKDACRGDSGGPLMLSHSDGKFYIIGIVSFGRKCAEPGVPGVYTRVNNFLDWIEMIVENTS